MLRQNIWEGPTRRKLRQHNYGLCWIQCGCLWDPLEQTQRQARAYRRHNNGAASLFSALFISTHSLKIFRGMLWITRSTEKHSLCILLKGTLSAELFFKVYFVMLYLALYFVPGVFALRNTIWRISHCSRDSGWRLAAICPFIFHAYHDLYMLR